MAYRKCFAVAGFDGLSTLARVREIILFEPPAPSWGARLSRVDFDRLHRDAVAEGDPAFRAAWDEQRLLLTIAVGGRAVFVASADDVPAGELELCEALTVIGPNFLLTTDLTTGGKG